MMSTTTAARSTSSAPPVTCAGGGWAWPRTLARLSRDEMLQKSLLSIVDQAVVSATNFAITVLIGRVCGKPEVGLYYLALQVVFLARGVQEQVIVAPYLVYSGHRRGEEAAKYSGSVLMHECIFIALTAIVMTVGNWCGLVSSELSSVLWLLVTATPLMLLREFARQNAFANLRIKEVLALDVFVCGLQLVMLALAAWFDVLDAKLTFSILAIGCGIASIIWFVRRGGIFLVDRHRILPDWKHNWHFGRWALATQLLGSSMPLVIPWIVAAMHGEAATAALGVGTTLIGFANMFVLGLSNFICPRAARAYAHGKEAELKIVLRQAALMHLSVLVPFALTIFFAGDRLMAFVYGPEFADAGQILGILAFGALVNSMGIVAGNGLWAMERPSANFRSDVCAMIAWLIATAVLVGPFGPVGAAIASVTGTLVGAIARLVTLWLNLRVRPCKQLASAM